jgi:hypothetical protein
VLNGTQGEATRITLNAVDSHHVERHRPIA